MSNSNSTGTANAKPRDALYGGSLETVLSLETIDDKLFFYGSDDGPIRAFSLRYGKRFQVIKGHSSHVNQLMMIKPTQSQLDVLAQKRQKDAELDAQEREKEEQDFALDSADSRRTKERLWEVIDNKRKTRPIMQKMRSFFNRALNKVKEEQHWRKFEVELHMRKTLPRACEGYTMYSCSRDGDIRYWNLNDFSCLQVFRGHYAPVNCIDVAYRSDQPYILASGGQDGTAIIWDTSTASIKKVIAGHAAGILSAKIMGNMLCTGSMDSFCRIVDIESNALTGLYQPCNAAIKAVCLRDSSVFMGAGDGLVYTFDIRSNNKCTHMFRDIHKESVNCITLSGNYLFTGSDDKDIVQWDTRTSRPVYVYRGHQGPVRCFSLAEEGKFLFSGSIDMSIRKWDIAFRQAEIDQEEELRKKFEEQKAAQEAEANSKKGKKKDAGKKGGKAKK